MDSLLEAKGVLPAPEKLLDGQIRDWPDRLLDLLPAAVYVCDRDGTIVRYNSYASKLWGRAPKLGDPSERFCGSHRMYRVDNDPLPHAECPMADVLHTGAPVRDAEVMIERPDGSRIVALVNIDALTDSAGRVIGAVNCFRELPDRRRAGSALHEHERQSHALLGTLPMAVYMTDAAGRIQYFNEAAASLWGRYPELGKSEWCGSWRLYWPDGRPMPHDQCPMAVALKEGRPIQGAEAVAERPDGTRVPFLAYPTPLYDESGVLVGAMNALLDMTEHKRSEHVKQRLSSIVESSDDAILSKSLDGVIMSWNQGAERLFGYTAEETVGQPITMLIPADRHNEEPEILSRVRQGERVDHYETVRRRKDGSLIDISLSVSPIRDAGGRIVGASKIARDITDRKRAQEQQALVLREMNHRVKNLFALAAGVVTLSARSARNPEDLAAAVRERLIALSRAHELTLRNPREGTEAIDQATTLAALVGTIVSPHVDLAHGDADRMIVRGPEVQVSRQAVTSVALLLHELVTNAVKYGALSTSSGRIDVTWTVGGNQLGLTWTERGGPRVDGPATYEGFGTMLARRTVTGQLDGTISRDWQPEGLIVHLTVRLDRLAA